MWAASRELHGVVLHRSGATGIIARHEPQGPLTVERWGVCGRAVLDEGGTVNGASLRLIDDRLSWLSAGAERTAPACPAPRR